MTPPRREYRSGDRLDIYQQIDQLLGRLREELERTSELTDRLLREENERYE